MTDMAITNTYVWESLATVDYFIWNDWIKTNPNVSLIFNQKTLSEVTIEHKKFINVTFKDCSFYNVTFQECEFINCIFKKTNITHSTFNECSFTESILSIYFNTTTFNDCHFKQSVFKPHSSFTVFNESSFTDVSFLGVFVQTTFKDTSISESMFQSSFYNCKFNSTTVFNSNFLRVKFTECAWDTNTIYNPECTFIQTTFSDCKPPADMTRIFQKCPEKGAFIAYKKLRNNLIAELLIPADAKRLSSTTNKCRASKADVIRIYHKDTLQEYTEGSSIYSYEFKYRVGYTVYPEYFDSDVTRECAGGIHFFMQEEFAKQYNL